MRRKNNNKKKDSSQWHHIYYTEEENIQDSEDSFAIPFVLLVKVGWRQDRSFA